MTEQCSNFIENNEKLTFSSENLDIVNEVDCVEEKDNLTNYPFDHMYACNSNSNSELPNNSLTGESEVKHLQELLLVHLEFIQQQSEHLINKDKQILTLQRENEMLKQRLDRLERGVNHVHSSNNLLDGYVKEDMTHDTLYNENLYTEEKPIYKIEDDKRNIELLDVHFSRNNIIDIKSEVKPKQELLVNPEEDNVVQQLEREDNMVTEMRLKRNSNQETDEAIGKCFNKSRNLLNRNQSPSISISKLREELTKPILTSSKRSKSGERPATTAVNNENSITIIGASSSTKNSAENRRSRHRKSKFNNKRKRLCSGNSIVSNVSSESKRTKVSSIKRDTVLTTDNMYYTQMGFASSKFSPAEDIDVTLNTGTTTTNLEVPSWRVKVFTSCYSMEGTENLDDDVFNKRHLRLENDERRRKRWDVQRIREQRHIEKLKQRQERVGSGGRTIDDHHISETPTSLWPSLEDVKFIEITEHLPVCAFGVPIAQFTPSEFSLPWLNPTSNTNNTSADNSVVKKSRKKSSRRRRSNKR